MNKKGIICGTVLIISLIIGAAIIYIIFKDSYQTCTSKDCVRTASEILSHVEPSLSPCSDFRAFACTRSSQEYSTSTSSSSSSTNSPIEIASTRNVQILSMLSTPVSSYDSSSLIKTKSLFAACRNESSLNGSGNARVFRSVLSELGGWPLLERGDWRGDTNFHWTKAVAQLRRIGIDFDAFFKTDIVKNDVDETRYMVKISQGSGIITDGPPEEESYKQYMISVAGYFGADVNRALIETKEVFEFERLFRKISERKSSISSSTPPTTLRSSSTRTELKTVSLIQLEFPIIPWLDYINGVLYPASTITSDEAIRLDVDVNYLQEFARLLHRTPKRILANFMVWQVIQKHIPYLPEELRYIRDRYRGKRQNREDVCLQIILETLPYSIEASYVRNYISDEAKRLTRDIINYIKLEFKRIIPNLDWIDEDAKQVAKEKLASSKDYIAHTPDAPNLRKFELLYEQIKATEDNFLRFILNINLANLNLKYGRLIENVHEDEHDKVVYSVKENTLVIPSDYLQAPLFGETRQQYLNFGGAGTLIAYHLANILLEGRLIDLYGNLREWSTSQSLLLYDNRTKCVSTQYAKLYIPDPVLGEAFRNLNASITKLDDVAYLIGRRVAYGAWTAWASNHETEERLPGLSYTASQLFWISSALYECSRDSESKPETRVTAALSNVPEFSEDFRCEIGTGMNPFEKCLFW